MLAPRCRSFGALPWLAKAIAVGLCAAVAALAVVLWPIWLHDDNFSHGLFLPFLAALLVAESRRDPSPRFLSPGVRPVAACGLLVIAGWVSFAAAIICAAALGSTDTIAEFMLALALVFALAAAWIGFADRRVGFLPLNWAAAVAVLVWLFAAPPPPGTYARLASFLQTRVAESVVRVLNLVGIAAYQSGNVIELARTSVGVSEACSGIRSLISCTVAGLVFSGLLVRRPLNRVLVIVLSPAIGLAMNFLRSLLLTLLANSGVGIEGRWHDLTGASIIVGTTLLVAALASWLRRREPPAAPAQGDPIAPTAGRSPQVTMVAASLFLAAAVCAVLAARSPDSADSHPAPDLAALLPEPPEGWTVQTTPDLERFSGTLQTHSLVERVYAAGPTLQSAHLTLYLAYWQPGQAPVSLVEAHTPESCWPGTGWEAEPVPIERTELPIEGRVLPPAECRLFALNAFETHVWYWHLYGRRPLAIVNPRSAVRLLRLGWRYGFSRAQDQLFVRVSSNRPWQEVAALPALRRFFANLRPMGL